MDSFIEDGQTYNATIVTRADGVMWLVPTAGSDKASRVAEDYSPQSIRAMSGGYSYQPIFHPFPEAIEATSGS